MQTPQTFFVPGNNLGYADSAYKANDDLAFYDNLPDNLYSKSDLQPHQLAELHSPAGKGFLLHHDCDVRR